MQERLKFDVRVNARKLRLKGANKLGWEYDYKHVVLTESSELINQVIITFI